MQFQNCISTLQVGGATVAGLAISALYTELPWIGGLAKGEMLTSAAYIVLTGGIIVAVIAFFGCVGACCEVKCMLFIVRRFLLH